MATFGDSSAGTGTANPSSDRAWLSKFAPSSSGVVTQINVIWDATSGAGTNFKGLIYDDNAGVPGNRLGVGNATSVPAGGGDIASTGLSVSVTSGVNYWIGAVSDNFTAVHQCDTTPSNASRMESTTYASPAATWVEAGTGAAQLNVYATYTTGPTISDDVDSVTLYEGQTANFAVTASGSGSLTYQWQRNTGGGFSDLGGETNSTLAVSNVTFSMNGYKYRVNITDTGGTTTSAEGWLTVRMAWRSAWIRA